MRILNGHTGPVRCLAYSPDGRTLASGGDDRTVRLWDVGTGKERAALSDNPDAVRALAFTPGGKRMAWATWDGGIFLRSHPRGKSRLLAAHPRVGGAWSLAFAPDGWSLALGLGNGDGVLLWLSRQLDGGVTQMLRGRSPTSLTGHAWPVNAVAFAPDGLRLATGSHDRTLKLWDPNWGREQATLVGHQDWVRTLAFAPDSTLLASGGDDAVIKLWDLGTERERATLRGHEGPIRHLAFTPDGRTLLSGGWDATIRLWDPATGRPRAALDWKIGRVHCLAIAPDGMTAAAGADGSVLVWDLDPLD